MPEYHNHVTRDIKPLGQCPGCDMYHYGQESRNGGESGDTRRADQLAERATLVSQLDATGHGGCAYDLEHADEIDVADIAYQVAEHVEEACGDTDFAADPELADRIRQWANKLERVDPVVARRGKIPVTVHRDGGQVLVDVKAGDLLDLSREGDTKVTLTLDGVPMMDYMRIDTPPGRNGEGN